MLSRDPCEMRATSSMPLSLCLLDECLPLVPVRLSVNCLSVCMYVTNCFHVVCCYSLLQPVLVRRLFQQFLPTFAIHFWPLLMLLTLPWSLIPRSGEGGTALSGLMLLGRNW